MKASSSLRNLFVAVLALTAVACSDLDVVGKGSVASLDKVLRQIPHLVTADTAYGGWSLSAPDGSVRFIWSKNYATSPLDVLLELDAAPFLAAGLNPEKLAGLTLQDGRLRIGTKLGQEQLAYQGEATPLAAYEHLVRLKRSVVGYHGTLDHYGITVGNGNLFEWAKDMRTNDKDIVFVLNPNPFIAAGVDPNRVKGWTLAKVTVDDANGKPIEVDKLLKPFNLL